MRKGVTLSTNASIKTGKGGEKSRMSWVRERDETESMRGPFCPLEKFLSQGKRKEALKEWVRRVEQSRNTSIFRR